MRSSEASHGITLASSPAGRIPSTALSPEDQAAVDAFRAMLTALRTPEPWTPGRCQDVAVRVGPFVERAHPRPGDDHGPDIIAVALQHPGGSFAPYGARYRKPGRLRCETAEILGVWNPACTPLTHAGASLDPTASAAESSWGAGRPIGESHKRQKFGNHTRRPWVGQPYEGLARSRRRRREV
ncbi:hypothetical protein [Streptomyces sp. Ncost-T10-10d]|uniref:hypothetical protein n=1 Tax=Streptomyces sp. Ncost-T10-10d TaxID=1839774 RepID=UPI00081D8531|nr:hypothetical protein [Streptomyces sp. Ncost-T10-10d]SCF72646.1 hypothetical protein GA0115254_11354 [Streptomyces sp. Ncost-T10-10d]